jgi:hypothetical protein
MNEIIRKKCDEFIEKFDKFSENMKSSNLGLDKEIFDLINFRLPEDYKYVLLKYNGLSLLGNEVLGIDFNSENSLIQVKDREHNQVEYKMPSNIIPFSTDGRGNYYCFDTNLFNENSKICKIIFWQYGYSNNLKNNEIVNNSFIDWAEEILIDWTLEEYNYDGSRKV